MYSALVLRYTVHVLLLYSDLAIEKNYPSLIAFGDCKREDTVPTPNNNNETRKELKETKKEKANRKPTNRNNIENLHHCLQKNTSSSSHAKEVTFKTMGPGRRKKRKSTEIFKIGVLN
jgi:hypothetical protein